VFIAIVQLLLVLMYILACTRQPSHCACGCEPWTFTRTSFVPSSRNEKSTNFSPS